MYFSTDPLAAPKGPPMQAPALFYYKIKLWYVSCTTAALSNKKSFVFETLTTQVFCAP